MRKYFLFIAYVFLALLVRKEFHPFSRFPMYDRFPNWGYVFFLKNERNEIVPYNKHFSINKNAGYVAHTFYSLFNHSGFGYGDGKEEPAHMKLAGKELLETIVRNEPVNTFDFDTLQLYRRFYFLKDDKLSYRDDLMYEQRIKP